MSHYYHRDGRSCHEINGIPTTIQEAKRLQLIPSVTTILGAMAKPEHLEMWQFKQVALQAAQMADRRLGTDPADWVAEVVVEAFQQVEDAAALGTRVHAAIEAGLSGRAMEPEMVVYADPILAWARKKAIVPVAQELKLVNLQYGYAGTMDCAFRFGKDQWGRGVMDFKSKRTKRGRPVTGSLTHGLQLAAYAKAYWDPEDQGTFSDVLLGNVFFSTTEPGRMEVVSQPNPARLWRGFLAACELWRLINDYDPRVKVEDVLAGPVVAS